MSVERLPTYVLTMHARFEMQRRALSEEVVRAVLERPQQRWEVRRGRHVLQSKVAMGEPARDYVVRVFVDVDREPAEVVTAYRSSNIGKYWRPEP